MSGRCRVSVLVLPDGRKVRLGDAGRRVFWGVSGVDVWGVSHGSQVDFSVPGVFVFSCAGSVPNPVFGSPCSDRCGFVGVELLWGSFPLSGVEVSVVDGELSVVFKGVSSFASAGSSAGSLEGFDAIVSGLGNRRDSAERYVSRFFEESVGFVDDRLVSVVDGLSGVGSDVSVGKALDSVFGWIGAALPLVVGDSVRAGVVVDRLVAVCSALEARPSGDRLGAYYLLSLVEDLTVSDAAALSGAGDAVLGCLDRFGVWGMMGVPESLSVYSMVGFEAVKVRRFGFEVFSVFGQFEGLVSMLEELDVDGDVIPGLVSLLARLSPFPDFWLELVSQRGVDVGSLVCDVSVSESDRIFLLASLFKYSVPVGGLWDGLSVIQRREWLRLCLMLADSDMRHKEGVVRFLGGVPLKFFDGLEDLLLSVDFEATAGVLVSLLCDGSGVVPGSSVPVLSSAAVVKVAMASVGFDKAKVLLSDSELVSSLVGLPFDDVVAVCRSLG